MFGGGLVDFEPIPLINVIMCPPSYGDIQSLVFVLVAGGVRQFLTRFP